MSKSNKTILIIILIAAVIVAGGVYFSSQNKNLSKSRFHILSKKPAQPEFEKTAILDAQTDKDVYQKGDIITVSITLNTQKNIINATDVVLDYDPEYIVPTEENFLAKEGSIFSNFIGPDIDKTKGEVKFSALLEKDETFRGKGLVASLHFKAKKPGKTEITFLFEKNSTVDSNVLDARYTKDALYRVSDASFEIK